MGIFDRVFRSAPNDNSGNAGTNINEAEITELRELAQAGALALADNERISERLSELEVALEQEGWVQYERQTSRDLSRSGLQRMVRLARLMYLSNPLINIGVNTQTNYVWGQGLSIVADDSEINKVIQRMWNNRENRAEFTSSQALQMKEIELMVTGNLFLVLFTTPRGRVLFRSIELEEITEIICNPEDSKDPWYYKRESVKKEFDSIRGITVTNTSIEYYPDWQYRPDEGVRPTNISTYPIRWESPIYHIKTGGMTGMRFGVPEIYPALDWARAAQQDLQAYASIHQALSRFAWQLIVPNSANAVSAAKTRFSTTSSASNPHDNNPPPSTGATFIRNGDVELRPMQTRGMAPDPEEGHRLWVMAAAGLGLPETFLGNADVGNHATAATLDRPTELKFENRRRLWIDVLKDLCDYQIDQSALTRSGDLYGIEDDEDGTVTIYDKNDHSSELDRTVKISYPTLLERNVNTRVDAIVSAATLAGRSPAQTMTPRLLAQLLLEALNVPDVNGELDKMWGEDGGMDLPPLPAPVVPGGPGAGGSDSGAADDGANTPPGSPPVASTGLIRGNHAKPLMGPANQARQQESEAVEELREALGEIIASDSESTITVDDPIDIDSEDE